MRRSPSLPLLLVLALGPLVACSSPCRQLSEKLCECQETTPDRQSCEREVARAEGSLDRLTAEDEATCEELLEVCSCEQVELADQVESSKGKVSCGLARNYARAPAVQTQSLPGAPVTGPAAPAEPAAR